MVAGICWIQRSLRDRDAKVEEQEILREVIYLVGGFKYFLFSRIYGIILPID